MPGTSATIAALPRRIVRNVSVATRLSLVILLVALLSLVVTSIVGLQRGSELADSVLEARVRSVGAARADEVERYVASLRQATVGQAISPSTAQAIEDFTDAYAELDATPPTDDDIAAVDRFYTEVVVPELSEVRDRPVNPTGFIPRGQAATTLQARYVVSSSETAADVDDDSSGWSVLNRRLDESFDEFVVQSGVDDLYLIEPDFFTIVYSSAKGIDFGTSLLTGPQSGSALATLIQSLDDSTAAGAAAVRDFTNYAAAGDEPSMFVASPVHDGDVLAGFVAVRVGSDGISAITTNGGSWSAEGDTGETFVVARDELMRSDARGFVEDREAYLTAVAAAGTATDDQIRAMRTFGTTVLFQALDGNDVDAALDLEPALVETTNRLGADVLQARRSLQIDGLDWAVISEIELQELQQPIVDFARYLLIAIALLLVTITFIASRWSDRLLRTLRLVATRLRAVRSGADGSGADGEVGHTASLPEGAPTEFVELATDIDTMLETLATRHADAAERAEERRVLLRRILPPQAALRAEAGDSDVVDQVAHTTVAVIVVSGLGRLMQSGDTARVRALLDRFVDETDALARQRGLDRIRLTGDTYFAACGTVRPHIDHAARAVSFVLDVRDLVRDLGEGDERISITVGIDSGPVTVGLTGGSDLVYDAWGTTVQRAADLARAERPDTIFITSAVRAQLPATFTVEQADDAGSGTAVVSGRAHDAEAAR